jgi:hypothetical protein
MRHRVGQLDSVKALPFEELEAMRTETAARLKVLEEQYWGKVDNQEVGPRIREKYKQYGNSEDPASETSPKKSSKKDSKPQGGGILKSGGTESLAKPKFDYKNLKKSDKSGERSRSRSKKSRKV